jgi:hypothetical protein
VDRRDRLCALTGRRGDPLRGPAAAVSDREHADVELDAAVAAAVAAGIAVGDADRTLTTFQGTYQIGLGRTLNSISISYPPSVSMNLGGFVGTLSGTDGYDAQFHTRELEYQAAVDRAQAAAEAAEFRQRAISAIQEEHRSLGAVIRGMLFLVGEARAGGSAPDAALLRC